MDSERLASAHRTEVGFDIKQGAANFQEAGEVENIPVIFGAEPEQISLNQIGRVELPAEALAENLEFDAQLRPAAFSELGMQPPLAAMGPCTSCRLPGEATRCLSLHPRSDAAAG